MGPAATPISMKVDTRSPVPTLTGAKLEFFYGILTLWESPEQNKVIKDFKSSEIKRFLGQLDRKGNLVLFLKTDINTNCPNCKYELYVNNTKNNTGLSLLYHLRNAFAHNKIQILENGNMVCIENYWKGKLKLKTRLPFSVLKELIETIRGMHNLTIEEKKKKYSKPKKK